MDVEKQFEKKYISNKAAKEIFSKFLMANNCLREFIVCYKYCNNLDSTPSEICDRVINTLCFRLLPLGNAFSNILASFHWESSFPVLCPMLGVPKNKERAYTYWIGISRKFKGKYESVYIEK